MELKITLTPVGVINEFKNGDFLEAPVFEIGKEYYILPLWEISVNVLKKYEVDESLLQPFNYKNYDLEACLF